jgi:hypothetical protein
MPVLWGVIHSTRLVTITVKGATCRQDIDACTDGIMTPATLSYRKLLDLTQGSLTLSSEDVAALAERVRAHGRAGVIGPLAIVARPGDDKQQALLFEALSTAADRPLRVFCDLEAARDWFDAIPPTADRTDDIAA